VGKERYSQRWNGHLRERERERAREREREKQTLKWEKREKDRGNGQKRERGLRRGSHRGKTFTGEKEMEKGSGTWERDRQISQLFPHSVLTVSQWVETGTHEALASPVHSTRADAQGGRQAGPARLN
jgi:hypothetical protein